VTVTVVLDTSAVLAYTKGSIAVGELLAIVADDEDTALIPAACLAEAFRQSAAGDEAMLNVLSTVRCVEVALLQPDRAPKIGISSRGCAGIDVGHAITEAVAHNAQMATPNVQLMTDLLPAGWPIIEL
jgi:hypothetical protein